jgi:hypothetical protein
VLTILLFNSLPSSNLAESVTGSGIEVSAISAFEVSVDNIIFITYHPITPLTIKRLSPSPFHYRRITATTTFPPDGPV